MLHCGFPADDLFSPIVFRVAVWHAIPVRNIKDRELAALIVTAGSAVYDLSTVLRRQPDHETL
jgi:hypothetical protein